MLQPVSHYASHVYIYMYLYRLRDEGKRRSGRLWLRLVLEGMGMDWIGCVLGDWRVMRSETPSRSDWIALYLLFWWRECLHWGFALGSLLK